MSSALSPQEHSQERLGDALRRLMDAFVLYDVKAAGEDAVTTMDSISEAVDSLTARLTARQLKTMPWPDEASMRRAYRPYSPVIGNANPLAPPLMVEVDPEGVLIGQRAVVATAVMKPIHEGPPGAVHGGWVAALLDQLLGHANAVSGAGGMTIELTVRYLRRTPYNVPLTLKARCEEVEGRRVRASGEIIADGIVTAEATGLFLTPSQARIDAMRELVQNRSSGE